MSSSCPSCADPRPSAAELNQQIRALVACTPVWTPTALAAYRRLVAAERDAATRERLEQVA